MAAIKEQVKLVEQEMTFRRRTSVQRVDRDGRTAADSSTAHPPAKQTEGEIMIRYTCPSPDRWTALLREDLPTASSTISKRTSMSAPIASACSKTARPIARRGPLCPAGSG